MFSVFKLLILTSCSICIAKGFIADSKNAYNFLDACDTPDTVILLKKVFRIWISQYPVGINCSLILQVNSEVSFEFQWLQLRDSCIDYLQVTDLQSKSSLKLCSSEDRNGQFSFSKTYQIKLKFVSSSKARNIPTKENGFFLTFTEIDTPDVTTDTDSFIPKNPSNKSSTEFYIPLVLTLLVLLPACFCVLFSIIQRRRSERQSNTRTSRPRTSVANSSLSVAQIFHVPQIVITPADNADDRETRRPRPSTYPPTYDSIYPNSEQSGISNAETQTDLESELEISFSPPCYNCAAQNSPSCSHQTSS